MLRKNIIHPNSCICNRCNKKNKKNKKEEKKVLIGIFIFISIILCIACLV